LSFWVEAADGCQNSIPFSHGPSTVDALKQAIEWFEKNKICVIQGLHRQGVISSPGDEISGRRLKRRGSSFQNISFLFSRIFLLKKKLFIAVPTRY